MAQSTTKQSGRAFRLTRRFAASREKVFDAWTNPEVLKQWWCPEGWVLTEVQIELRIGGAFRIGMRRWSGGSPVYVNGCFHEVSVPERLAYTWRWENAFEGMPETCVTVEFKDAGGATELSLIHAELPEIPICLQHRRGWLAALERIDSIVTEDFADANRLSYSGSPKQ